MHYPHSFWGYQHSRNFCFYVLLTVHLSIFISVINHLDAQNFCFTASLFHSSTCFEHMCSSSGGQNCITQPLVSSCRCNDTRGCVMQFWPPDDEHMCSKHVEEWNKLAVKQKFCASSLLITEINSRNAQLEDRNCSCGCVVPGLYVHDHWNCLFWKGTLLSTSTYINAMHFS